MNVTEFIEILEQHKNKELLFFYAQDKLVGANYHLTEVKNVQFDTTDCGGKTNFWEETHFQLWESPNELEKRTYMTTNKIASIISRVDGIKPIKKETELKIEYGNKAFSTSVMPIKHIKIDEKRVYVNLFSEATRCKAKDARNIPLEQEQKEACSATSNCC